MVASPRRQDIDRNDPLSAVYRQRILNIRRPIAGGGVRKKSASQEPFPFRFESKWRLFFVLTLFLDVGRLQSACISSFPARRPRSIFEKRVSPQFSSRIEPFGGLHRQTCECWHRRSSIHAVVQGATGQASRFCSAFVNYARPLVPIRPPAFPVPSAAFSSSVNWR